VSDRLRLPSEASLAVFVFAGAILPMVVTNYLVERGSE
jgi:hypothetical protein